MKRSHVPDPIETRGRARPASARRRNPVAPTSKQAFAPARSRSSHPNSRGRLEQRLAEGALVGSLSSDHRTRTVAESRAVLPLAVTDTASFHEPFFGSLIVNVPRPALTSIVFLTAL